MLFWQCCVQSHAYLQYRHGMIEVTVQRLNHVFALEYSRSFHYSKQRGWFCALGADWHPVVTLVWPVENISTSLSACFGVDGKQLDVCLHNNLSETFLKQKFQLRAEFGKVIPNNFHWWDVIYWLKCIQKNHVRAASWGSGLMNQPQIIMLLLGVLRKEWIAVWMLFLWNDFPVELIRKYQLIKRNPPIPFWENKMQLIT